MTREILLTGLIGMVVGGIDILPMVKMKLDRYSIASAFVFYFILPFVVLNMALPGIAFWLKGAILGPVMALPTIIIVAKEDKKSVLPMLVMSAVLGCLSGTAGYFLV